MAMKKTRKSALSLILVLCVLASLAGLAVYAEDEPAPAADPAPAAAPALGAAPAEAPALGASGGATGDLSVSASSSGVTATLGGNDILVSGKELFLPGAHTELRAQHSRSRRVTLVNGNLMGNARSDVSGIGARVYKNGSYGFSSKAELSADAAAAVLAAASENAAFMDAHAPRGRGALPVLPAEQIRTAYDIPNAEQKTYIDFLQGLDAHIAAGYPNLVSRTLVAFEDSMEKMLVTSDGADAHTIIPRSYVYLILDAMTKDGVPVELYVSPGGLGTFGERFKDPADLYEQVDMLYERLMDKREGIYAEAGEKTVILGGMMTGMLAHEAVGHTVEADIVLGGSVVAHKLGKRVASDLVNMTDFAQTAFGEPAPLPVYADDEGTKAVDCPLIRDGILVGYMNSRESAQHFGMEPMGNARGFAFSDEPLIRMRNTAVHPGNDKLEDMIASVDDGYYLLDSTNGEADTTGEFMFGVSMGYEIKNGKLGRALLDTTVSGIAFEMLKTVDMISDEVVWVSSGFCGKKQFMPVGIGGPALRCRITVGGR